MIHLSSFIGQQAIALGSAEKGGKVKGVAIEHDRIVAVELSDQVIPASAVRSFEGDVVTYDEGAGAFAGAVTPLDPRGKRVLDMAGDGHGHIADLAIGADGTIETVLLDTREAVPGGRLRVIGAFAAILADELPPPTGAPTTP
jgi:hypothetical protein